MSTVQQQYYIADCVILGYKQRIAYLGFVEDVPSQKLIDIFILIAQNKCSFFLKNKISRKFEIKICIISPTL